MLTVLGQPSRDYSINNQSRPGNCIHEKAYAANAATVIGIIVAGTTTINEDMSAFGTSLLSKRTSKYASPKNRILIYKYVKIFGFGSNFLRE